MADRQRAAIESRTKDPARESAARGEVAATPPKASSAKNTSSEKSSDSASSAAKPDTTGKTAPASTEAAPEPSASNPESSDSPAAASTEASATTAPKGPRYEVKAFKRYLEDNPEEGAQLLKAVGVLTQDTEGGFIKLANKRRKVREELTTREREIQTKQEARDREITEKVTKAEAAVKSVSHVADMWEAAAKKREDGTHEPDFDMVDEAFKTNMRGLTLDQYLRMRARRGVANPESARLKAENARLARELAEKTKGAAAEPAKEQAQPTAAAAPAEPKVNALELWGPDVPKSHGLRQFDGWANDLHAEMQKYHDETTDEYSVDVEDVAAALLKKKREALAPVEEFEQAAPRARKTPAAPAKRPNTPSSRAPAAAAERAPGVPKLNTEAPEKFMSSMQDRERWALERAEKRRRGEQVD